jgi:hypothetical protein
VALTVFVPDVVEDGADRLPIGDLVENALVGMGMRISHDEGSSRANFSHTSHDGKRMSRSVQKAA